MLSLWLFALLPAATADDGPYRCQPTRPDDSGPFYRRGAPEVDRVGSGYLLRGVVRSAVDCAPLPGAKVEVWLNGPDGSYGDRWRATLYAAADGGYRFESHPPVAYGSRPPHIHIMVNAAGFKQLITQHYPQPGAHEGGFDLVLLPAQ